jgi:hypothetical protein
MRLKSVVKYYIFDSKNGILIFYAVIAAVMVLFSFSIVSVNDNNNVLLGGADMASAIFLFVAGLNSFKQNYLFLSTNGITRKAQFQGFLIIALMIAAGMAAIDTIYSNILSQFVNYKSMFSQLYSGISDNLNTLSFILENYVWSITLYLFSMLLGYFITTAYYRMSRALKIIISVSVPVFFSMVFPAIDYAITGGKISRWIGDAMSFCIGKNPFIATVSYVAGAALFSGLSYLLVRRAPVRQ